MKKIPTIKVILIFSFLSAKMKIAMQKYLFPLIVNDVKTQYLQN